MTERDDIAWIEARERGVTRDHPRAALYTRLGAAIGALPELSSGDGWRSAILDQLDADACGAEAAGADDLRRARAARVRRRVLVAVISALAVAAVVLLLVRPGPVPRVSASLSLSTGTGDARRATGDVIAIGTRVTLAAELPTTGQLWIYRGERLVLRCPGADGCTAAPIRGGVRVGATFRTEAALTHTILLVEGGATPTGALTTDAATPTIRASQTFDVH